MISQQVARSSRSGGFLRRSIATAFLALVTGGAGMAQQPPAPPVGKQWNHVETQNFVVLAINPEHRDYLGQSMEFMRKWAFDRWGMKQVDFSVKCMVLVAADRDEYKKLFNGKDAPAVRIDREPGGKIKALTIWCWADPKFHAAVLPRLLTEVCLAEFEQAYKVKFPLWLHRGMGVLNGSLPEIRREVADLSQVYAQNLPCFWSEDILTMTEDKLEKYQSQNRQWYDKQAAVMCLYVLKTHGQKKFLDFLDGSLKSPQAAVPILGVPGYKELDAAFNKFMYNLSHDVAAGKSPDGHLTWTAK